MYQLRETRNRRMTKQNGKRQIHVECLLNRNLQHDRVDGITAQGDKIIIDADRRNAQRTLPYLLENFLISVAGLPVWCVNWSGQSTAGLVPR